jgi:hypothetical protein
MSEHGLKDVSPLEKQPTIAVDFDGVIANYDGWTGSSDIGSPREDVLDVLRTLHAEGWKIIVYSCRGAEEFEAYLLAHGIPFDEINQNPACPTGGVKPVANVYWDDRAYRYSGDAHEDIKGIRKFRTWSGRR